MSRIGPDLGRGCGPGVVVPGYPQWVGGERERGLILSGSYASAAAVAIFAWGSATGLAVLAFAFAVHVTSAADAVRRLAFPGPVRRATLPLVGLGLAASVYAPLLAVASVLAWPGVRTGASPGVKEGYLVNCWAYRRAEPRRGDRVWYRPAPRCAPRVGRVVAGRGEEVEWSGDRLRIDGRRQILPDLLRGDRVPREVAYRVPEGHVLVRAEGSGSPRPGSGGLVMVARDQIVGRAWAKLYPVRERRLFQ